MQTCEYDCVRLSERVYHVDVSTVYSYLSELPNVDFLSMVVRLGLQMKTSLWLYYFTKGLCLWLSVLVDRCSPSEYDCLLGLANVFCR